jgi:type II secretory pathway component PulM
VSDELAIVYLATSLTQKMAEPEETEQLQIQKLPFEKVYEMVESGQITDSMTVAAIYKIKLMMIQGKIK